MESTKLNQWRNTDVVIEWFKSIENKGETSCIIFDIGSFYLLYHQNYQTRVQTLQNPYTVYPIMI